MRIFKKCQVFLLVVLMFMSTFALAQEVEEQYNPNSINPIPKYEHLFKRRVWVDIDLKEKQNKGFFSQNGEITRLIIDAVKSGEISTIYKNDSLTSTMTKEEFFEGMVASEAAELELWDPDFEYYEGDVAEYNGQAYTASEDIEYGVTPGSDPRWKVNNRAGKADLFFPTQIQIIRMVEDRIFDKRRSRMYYDIQSFEIIVPGSQNSLTGLEKSLGVFAYKDLERVFRNHPKEAVWFNRYNTAENKNFADAFLLRLFHGVLMKVENPDNIFIADNPSYMGDRKQGVMASEWTELQLMEKEHNLWEY